MSKKIIYSCQVCGKDCEKVSHKKDAILYCSLECKNIILDARIKKVSTNCSYCDKPIEIRGFQRKNFLKTNKSYCSKDCSSKVNYINFVEAGKKARNTIEFKNSTIERMKNNNPMWIDGVKEKMINSSKGKTFLSRGGNGKLTKHQLMVFEKTNYPMEYPINTSDVRHLFQSVPNSYKVDLAIVDKKIAIEIDGASHKLKKWKFLDRRKTEILNALGWKVIRFTNQQIELELEKCLDIIKQHDN